MPLGLMPGMGYEEKEIVLEEGEAALFYSDGLVEAHGPKGEMFGFPRLRALMAKHGSERSLGTLLLEELYSFVGEGWDPSWGFVLMAYSFRTRFSGGGSIFLPDPWCHHPHSGANFLENAVEAMFTEHPFHAFR